MKVFMTTYFGCDSKKEVFIRVNATHNGAWDEAHADLTESLDDYKHHAGNAVIDGTEREVDEGSSILRIINNDSGYEYEAYIITEVEVGE